MYEIYIETRRIPFLNFEAPHYMRKWKARQVLSSSYIFSLLRRRLEPIIKQISDTLFFKVMSYPLVKMGLVMKVGEAYAILNNCGHNGFPIVNDAGFID